MIASRLHCAVCSLFFLLCIIACTGKPAPVDPPDAISTSTLRGAFDSNEVSADKQYRGKRIKVVGDVESVSKGFLGTPYVHLSHGITCRFSDSDLDRLAKITKGERIVIEGICEGTTLVQCTIPPIGEPKK